VLRDLALAHQELTSWSRMAWRGCPCTITTRYNVWEEHVQEKPDVVSPFSLRVLTSDTRGWVDRFHSPSGAIIHPAHGAPALLGLRPSAAALMGRQAAETLALRGRLIVLASPRKVILNPAAPPGRRRGGANSAGACAVPCDRRSSPSQ